MNNRFGIDRYKRIEQRKNEKKQPTPNRNQPKPQVWVISISDIKQNDQVMWYRFAREKAFDLSLFAENLGTSLGVNLEVYPYLNYIYDVWLTEPVTWGMAQRVTKRLLGELE